LAHHGVAVNHFNLGARALEPLNIPVPLRIMPLGASITWGQGSSEGNGYRNDLCVQLSNAGNRVNMVGSRRSGSMKDNDLEGWPGYRIDQVHVKGNASLGKWKPNVVLINVGTNDAVQNANITMAGQRMELLLNDLYALSPRAVVLLSTLLVNKNPSTERNVVSINQQFKDVVRKLRVAGRKIAVADMHSDDGPAPGDLVDQTHPNDVGYKKMANIWYAGLLQASDAGWLQSPEFVEGVPDDGA
jgi:lysophospholipase L1-like esterase